MKKNWLIASIVVIAVAITFLLAKSIPKEVAFADDEDSVLIEFENYKSEAEKNLKTLSLDITSKDAEINRLNNLINNLNNEIASIINELKNSPTSDEIIVLNNSLLSLISEKEALLKEITKLLTELSDLNLQIVQNKNIISELELALKNSTSNDDIEKLIRELYLGIVKINSVGNPLSTEEINKLTGYIDIQLAN